MNSGRLITDANEACASVAYRLSETIAIYPITPSSTMAELCDEWATAGHPNTWSVTPQVVQMQSEAGVAGAVHGALMAGSLTTTFTASQGLLLMIPNMYKIAGELTPFVMHVSARALATHALSIFGDHSDVMACRQTGFAMLCSSDAQEAQDLAAIAHAATLQTRIPILHFFDGFRTSHEINTYQSIDNHTLAALICPQALGAFRARGLSPDAPALHGTAQNPDVFFQAREASNTYYNNYPRILEEVMQRFHSLTGRQYSLYEYTGALDATDVVVVMGSASQTLTSTADYLNKHEGKKLGVLKVRSFRPFNGARLAAALPKTVRRLAVLDRTKEPGAVGEPLFMDVATALVKTNWPVVGGRYGLGSKEFTPAMARAVLLRLASGKLRHGFTIGINDDVTLCSLPYDDSWQLPSDSAIFQALFFGLGADGTVGANKNSIKIIGDQTGMYAQAYFQYDSKKSGTMTASHLRFGRDPIRAPYLVRQASFVAVHHFQHLFTFDLLRNAAPGATVLLNCMYPPAQVWSHLPRNAQEHILAHHLQLYTIDALQVARQTGMGGRINTIMQTCFFAISGIMPQAQAIAAIRTSIQKTYARKGDQVVQQNFAAVDTTLTHLYSVPLGTQVDAPVQANIAMQDAPDFVKRVTAIMLAGEGDRLPVSAFPVDGVWPMGTTRYEKRNIAAILPVWDPQLCIQCGKCSFVCPHSAIRAKYYPADILQNALSSFKSTDYKSRDNPGMKFTIQVSPQDCTGCTLCAQVCPAIDKTNPQHKALDMHSARPLVDVESLHWRFFDQIPPPNRATLGTEVKATQFKEPLFEFSGACSGCGETPYIRLLTQLYGDRLIIANATGCSSIYGGNLPTTPYTVDTFGRGPAWANSLFEDNAEFGFGLRIATDQKKSIATDLLAQIAPTIGDERVRAIIDAPQSSEAEIATLRLRVAELKQTLRQIATPQATLLHSMADSLVRKSVWVIGGDGWAYDIGFGGLDHVLAQGRKINILVIDTEVYSNTGGQQSKSTPIGAIAKFAASGKGNPKKDLGLMMMGYGNVYVASIAMGAKDSHTLQVLQEAESYPGPSLVIAYSHCISHGFDLSCGMAHHRLAVDSGYWLLYRYDPRRTPPLRLDMKAPSRPVQEYLDGETRWRALRAEDPDRATQLAQYAQGWIDQRWLRYSRMAAEAEAIATTT